MTNAPTPSPASRKRVLTLNGPNLNLLGTREPEIYGSTTLADIEAMMGEKAHALGFDLVFRQSNTEGTLIDWIQEARHTCDGIIINAGAYSHTSIAIYDALLSYEGVVIEVHLSNLFKRETFRHHSTITPAAKGLICGFGATGYLLAMDALAAHWG